MEWIEIKDKMPEKDVFVLVFCPRGNLDVPFKDIAKWTGIYWEGIDEIGWSTQEQPTHWMPLPDNPHGNNQTKTIANSVRL